MKKLRKFPSMLMKHVRATTAINYQSHLMFEEKRVLFCSFFNLTLLNVHIHNKFHAGIKNWWYSRLTFNTLTMSCSFFVHIKYFKDNSTEKTVHKHKPLVNKANTMVNLLNFPFSKHVLEFTYEIWISNVLFGF